MLLFTEDGLYVETLFPDGRRYPANGRRHLSAARRVLRRPRLSATRTTARSTSPWANTRRCSIEAEGWSLKENPVRPLTDAAAPSRIARREIAAPPEIALAVRGGAGTAQLARFAPALGGAVLDGSLARLGVVRAGALPGRQAADRRGALPLRPGASLPALACAAGAQASSRSRCPPIERIFTHDRLADTLSFYIQGDVDAAPSDSPDGRPGDVRVVFGLFEERRSDRTGGRRHVSRVEGAPGKPAQPQIYRTPVGQAEFAHVGAGGRRASSPTRSTTTARASSSWPRCRGATFPRLTRPLAGGLADAGELRGHLRRPQQVLVGQQRRLGQPRDLRRADRGPASIPARGRRPSSQGSRRGSSSATG